MARRLKQQRRGKGSSKYRVKKTDVKVKYTFNYTLEKTFGEITDIVHVASKSAPIAKVLLDSGAEFYTLASEGAFVGKRIEVGAGATPGLNNVLQLADVPAGLSIYNIESRAGSGGNFLRTSGAYGLVIGHEGKNVYVKMRSGEKKKFDSRSLCTLGIVSGSGRHEKPFMKAGNKFHAVKAKGARIYPVVRGYAMNAVDHPHGGSGHNSAGRQKNVSKKFGAPGQKVGHVGPKRTGRRKK